jgi:uncharacterized glyoxalase superfamily protein PhnB
MGDSSDVIRRGLVPYLFYEDAAAMLDWYRRVFGWVELGRWSGPDGRLRNAEMRVGDTELWLDGGGARYQDVDGSRASQWIGVWVDDVDAMYTRITSVGVAVEPPEDRQFGIRMLTVTDPEGYRWGFMRRLDPR